MPSRHGFGSAAAAARLLVWAALIAPPAVFTLCAGAGSAAALELSGPERVDAQTPRATPAGASFTIPPGWAIRTGGALVVLEPPETDTHVALYDAGAAGAPEAVTEAWAAYRPETKRTVKLQTPVPARDGWEDIQVFDYETSPNERAAVQAIALRFGTAWTVVVLDGTEPTFEKRGSQIGLIIQSLRPKGYEKETFAGRTAHPLDAERIAQVRAFVEESMKVLGIPGASIALVDGGKVVFEGGFGVRELGKNDPVDENTLFMAASNTKGMTTLLLARLVDEGKLSWDQHVTDVYPSFRLGDAEVTKQVLVRHLICACTGLPRQDLEWIFEFRNATPASSLALLGTMKPTSGFGEVFQYSNLMASAAGYIGAHLYYPDLELGAAYDRAMQEKIFDPLGMKSTTFDMERAQKGNYARPHADDLDGTPSRGDMAFNYSIRAHRPAGGVWTSSHDLIRYVQLELARGTLPDGTRLVSEKNLLERRAPQVSMGEDKSYGMGLMTDATWGVPVVHHGGSMGGYKSEIYLLPDHGIGAVLLTNSDRGQTLLRPFMRRLLEIVFDGKPEAADDVKGSADRRRAMIAEDRKRIVAPADAAAVAKLAGRYECTELGGLDVQRSGDTTVFDLGEWKSPVASRLNDDGSMSFITLEPVLLGLEFVVGTGPDGKRTLIMRDAQHEYVFHEAA